MKKLLKSYFFWTYNRGSFHYDILVTLILAFIFLAPRFWDFGDKPTPASGLHHPIQVVGNSDNSFTVTVYASDVNLDPNTTAPRMEVKRALRKAIEPVTGDAVFVEHWETLTDAQGVPVWKVWAHR
jgi:hypothetical protein